MARIVLEGLTKRFGAVTAVDNLTLTIEDGEFFALLGPSGCGKTTTLRLIAGLETPTQGRILIGDRDVTALPPRERDVAMVFQDYALYPHMTVEENVGYPLRVRGVPPAERRRRVREVTERLQIAHLLDRRPGQLSGGQQQRAAVARAVVHHPQVFLFDEPLSNLDAKLRLEARAFLKGLQREVGVTAVYVTHDQAEAMALADRIAVMNEGRILQVGTPLEIYRQPRTTFVASFIGNPPMNLLPCRVEWDKGGMQAFLIGEASGGEFRLDVTYWKAALRQAFSPGEEAILGVRPEHLDLAPTVKEGQIPGEVYVVQPLGAEVLVTLRVGRTIVSVRLFTDEFPTLPDRVGICLDPRRIHIYRADTGELIV